MGTTETSLQAKDGGRPKRPNITRKFPPPFIKCDSAFFVREAREDGMGKGGLIFRTVLLPLWFLRGELISLIFERGTLAFPYFEIPLFQWS
ncbi:hypothetical protein AVEN_99833-1 [Araneus ventricosus]|uniref:BEACH domain-containing protein n=1 Tax=Araneus ventricosus TaxID=182803 RepID=A0A4Y2JQ84_ARAVE|nr:hypothetical protein AVEN_99833-1 [Araneus ventricosus]